MALSLEVRKITLQKDRLVPIDEENFEVDRFKRALIDAVARWDQQSCDLKIVVDLRARVMTITVKNSGLTAGRIGLAILVEYARAYGDYAVIDKIAEPPDTMIEVGHFGIGSDPERFLGWLHYAKQVGSIPLRHEG